MHNKNWFPSLGVNGFKLSHVISNINIVYTVITFIFSWMFFINDKFYKRNYFIYYGISIGFILVSRYLMNILGKFLLSNIDEDSNNLESVDIESVNINFLRREYLMKQNKDNYFEYYCCICLQEQLFSTRCKLLPCSHDLYCRNCLNNIINLSNCPICRQHVSKIEINIRKI